MSLKRNFTLQSLAAKALVKKTMEENKIEAEVASPKGIIGHNHEFKDMNSFMKKYFQDLCARQMCQMKELYASSKFVVHLVYKNAVLDENKKNTRLVLNTQVAPGKFIDISLKTYSEVQPRGLGTVELLIEVENGYVSPYLLLHCLKEHKLEIKLEGKLVGIKSTFQFMRPKIRFEKKRATRISFYPRRAEQIKDEDVRFYICKSFDEAKKKLINQRSDNDTFKIEAFSITTPNLALELLTCPCQSFWCARYTLDIA